MFFPDWYYASTKRATLSARTDCWLLKRTHTNQRFTSLSHGVVNRKASHSLARPTHLAGTFNPLSTSLSMQNLSRSVYDTEPARSAFIDSATISEELVANGQSVKLLTRSWEPAADPEGVVVLVHGFSWHSAYFKPLAEKLTKAGYVVRTFDLQGHGRSESTHNIRGYVSAIDDHVQDVCEQLETARKLYKGVPIFAFGESMGGLLLLLLASDRDRETRRLLSGIILSAPVIEVAESVLPPRPIIAILRFLAKFFPRTSLPTSEIKDGHSDAFGDKALARQSLDDPLVIFEPPTLGFLDNVLKATTDLSNRIGDIELPFLVLHGTKDTRAELVNSQKLHAMASSRDKTFKQYHGGHHQLLQDLPDITAVVMEDITDWLRART